MSLDKSIEHGKDKRKPFRGPKAVDCSCRNHGDCPWCKNNRKYKKKKQEPVVEKDEETLELRLTHSITVEDKQVYRDIASISRNEDHTKQIIAKAWKEIQGWMSRYNKYNILSDFMEELATLIEQHQ